MTKDAMSNDQGMKRGIDALLLGHWVLVIASLVIGPWSF